MNQQALMRKLQKMQEEMVDTQKEIEETVFTASTSGIVMVKVYGTKEVKEIEIAEDFEVESKEDLEMLGDMITAACNVAYREIDKTTEDKMSKYQAMLGGMSPFM